LFGAFIESGGSFGFQFGPPINADLGKKESLTLKLAKPLDLAARALAAAH
jgi:hypothetical protein